MAREKHLTLSMRCRSLDSDSEPSWSRLHRWRTPYKFNQNSCVHRSPMASPMGRMLKDLSKARRFRCPGLWGPDVTSCTISLSGLTHPVQDIFDPVRIAYNPNSGFLLRRIGSNSVTTVRFFCGPANWQRSLPQRTGPDCRSYLPY